MTEAVLDACVLYSAPLRDFFMHLTVGFVFQPKWTEQIHAEWMENVLEHRPALTRESLERARALMDQWGRDWQVPPHAHRVPALSLPDEEDRHVLAAAIEAGVPRIVTFNLSDFPPEALARYGVRAVHPDDFVAELLEALPETFVAAVRAHRQALKSPPKSVEEYLETLRRCGLPQTATALERFAEEI
jgi:hypothetical protein